MATVVESSLSQAERRTLGRLVAGLESQLGEDLLALWLFGSKARGEQAGPETDIDLLVVTRRGSREDGELVRALLERSAGAEGTSHFAFQAIVHTPEGVAERRAKDTFFLREVDRDKIVLAGSARGEFGERIPFTRRGPCERGGVRARSEEYLGDARECLAAAWGHPRRESAIAGDQRRVLLDVLCRQDGAQRGGRVRTNTRRRVASLLRGVRGRRAGSPPSCTRGPGRPRRSG